MQQPPNYGGWPPQPQQPNTQYPPQQWQSPPPGYQQSLQQPPMMPQPVPPQAPKKKSKVGLIVGIVAALVLLSCIGAFALASKSGNSGTTTSSIATSTSNTPAATATTSSTTKHFKQTEAVQIGNTWDIEIISAKTSTGSEFNKPQKSGNVFLDFVIKVKNISNKEQDISSALQFTLLDSTGQKYDLTIDTDAGSTLNGKVEPNSLLQGSISYEVPSSVHNFTLAFEADIISQGQVIWDVHV
jgi:Domain of unknown function (DUF4352)